MSRTTTLLVLLVTVPLVLLAWLGTYLLRDAERRTNTVREGVIAERLVVADQQLSRDLVKLVEVFDRMAGAGAGGATPEQMAKSYLQHPWVTEAWSAIGPKNEQVNHFNGSPIESGSSVKVDAMPADVAGELWSRLSRVPLAEISAGAGVPGQPFVVLSAIGLKDWITYLKSTEAPLGLGRQTPPSKSLVSGLVINTLVRPIEIVYWRFTSLGVCGATLKSDLVVEDLFSRLPPPGMALPLGEMRLLDGTGSVVHAWGSAKDLAGASQRADHEVSAPLAGWRLSYTPSEEEVPQAYLFPIALGMGSGIILVIALAWLYFSESSREIDEAKARVSFVNQVSHELRTPLTNIRLYAEMAAHRFETNGDATGVKQLAVVESESARLGRLIQNVLAFARQQRDRLEIQPQDIVLDEVVQRVVEYWRPALAKKKIEIEVDCHGPAIMRADLDAIEQILGNLLSNVEKYGAPGRWVRISTNVAQERAVLRVRDRGPGIPSGKQKLVFEPFERLRSDLNEGVSGTGIGLTISRELAELHGGSLGIEGGQSQGACFILALPLSPIHLSRYEHQDFDRRR